MGQKMIKRRKVIAEKLAKIDAMVAEGATITEACKKAKMGLSTRRYHVDKEERPKRSPKQRRANKQGRAKAKARTIEIPEASHFNPGQVLVLRGSPAAVAEVVKAMQ